MMLPDFQDSYSDLYKGLHGFRPRGHSPETMLGFFDTYDEAFKAHEAEEAAELARYSTEDGIEYRNWSHYYDVKERKMEEAYERLQAEREEQAEYDARYNARMSPFAATEDFLDGKL